MGEIVKVNFRRAAPEAVSPPNFWLPADHPISLRSGIERFRARAERGDEGAARMAKKLEAMLRKIEGPPPADKWAQVRALWTKITARAAAL